ncbi:uncharacterized protein LOC107021542 [Solanum pennellii]|uniref:Uncharacterized protein LOC107021542 n=1 Tax=Solanum pennellii TaxID=28526 RepID=A0ABM1GYF7_SOLPN|nr:uncharacterized protein LOC107021542 [Solanum pennellii]
MELREELEELSEGSSNPWILGGNFNVILYAEEKLGGLPFTHSEVADFAHCVSNSALVELPTTGSKFTWCNGRIEEEYIFKWLDRVMVNHEFQDILPSSSVQHLIRQGLDHAPLLMANRCDLSKAEAELRKYLNIQEEFWRQKAGMRWFKDGDRNTIFYHTYVKGRRKELHIGEIKFNHEDVLKTNDRIGEATVDFFGDQFREADVMINVAMINNIPRVISAEQNDKMEELPSLEEIKTVVYKLNGDNTSGLTRWIFRIFFPSVL